MRLTVVRAVVAAALALPCAAVHAISPDKSPGQLSLEGWRVKDGLPGDSVRAIVQAVDARLWIATFGGTVRYDGTGFAPLATTDELKPGMADVRQLLAARDGSVWLAAIHRGPMRSQAGTTRSFGPADGLPAGTIAHALAEDDEGHVWMASGAGLWKYADERFLARPVRDLAGMTTTQLRIDHAGRAWLGTSKGLWLVAGDRLRRPDEIAIEAPVTALHIDAQRVLWIAAGGVLTGIDAGRVTRIDAAAGMPSAAVHQIASDGDGNLWLATATGLVRVREGRAQRFGKSDGLPADEITAITIDRERGLWIGTRQEGIWHLTDRTLNTHAVPPGLDATETLALCQDDEGAMWFGTRGGAVRWLDGRATWWRGRDGLPGEVATALLPDGPGTVWIGTQAGLVRWRAGRIEDPKIWPRRVRTLFRDRQGAVWIGGDGVVGRYYAGALRSFSGEAGLPAQVRAFAEDADGALWVSGHGGVFRRSGDGFVKITGAPDRVFGAVRAMLLDSEGGFWLTTGRAGLVRSLRGQWFSFDARVGLESDMLYGLVEDDRGDLWIGTNRSISRVARSSLEAVAAQRLPALQVASFEITDRRAGVIATHLHQPSAWKARDGALWFLTQQGAVRIDPLAIPTNKVPPRVTMDVALADGQAIPFGGRSEVERPPRRLEFRYSAVSLLEPRKVRYRHWLEGFDRDWVEAGDRRVAIYDDPPAGAYRFRVQASNNDGVWNERGANFTFVVGPPFYRRIWFWALCALALVPIAWLVHRGRVARLRAQYLGVFTERARMARELHDTFLQGMTTVSLQLHGLERHLEGHGQGHAQGPAPSPAASEQLALMRATVTQCLDETRRVVRGLREEDSRQSVLGPAGGTLGVALERLAQRLRATIPSAAPAALTESPSVPAEITVRVVGTVRPLPHAVSDELYRIGQEALTNALRHARARTIELGLLYEPNRVRLTVSDDGRGFDPAQPDANGAVDASLHFGLPGLRERVARLGGTLEVRSRQGSGTVVEAVVTTDPPRVLFGAKETLA